MRDVLAGEELRRFRHDLRTPLNHIIGFAEIMIDEAGDAGKTEPVPALNQIRADGYALLESMQRALPSSVSSMERQQLVTAGEALRPAIADLQARCSALEATGAYSDDPNGLENLQTIEGALKGMASILESGLVLFD